MFQTKTNKLGTLINKINEIAINAKTALWIKKLMIDLHTKPTKSTQIFVDNQVAISIAFVIPLSSCVVRVQKLTPFLFKRCIQYRHYKLQGYTYQV